MPTITVDGQQIECQPGQMIIDACHNEGIDVPHYCYHPGLSIVASCRICLVEVEGIPKLIPACQTAVRDGMVVHTNSSKAIANQKQVMEYLLVNHPLDCPVCDQAGECYLQDYSYQFGRAESRFEEDKAKKPKKDVGEHVLLYNDRCIMCTRCVRFTREVSGTSELFVEGRGHKEEIEIFPGKPLDNKLSGNVVDLCPVGALLDKDFLFKQRVWLLKQTPAISPADSGGENVWLEHNEGVIYRVKPRENLDVNGYWISDDTRYSYKPLYELPRLKQPRRIQYGSQVVTTYDGAIEAALSGLRKVVEEKGNGSLYALLSPMMTCEEAWLLGQVIRGIDPEAVLVSGPIPTSGEDEIFTHYETGEQTFVIKAEKVPNAAGIRRVMGMLGGPQASFEELAAGERDDIKKLAGGWMVGGYLSSWAPATLPTAMKKAFKVLQDIFESPFAEGCDVVLPSASFAEKDGSWENYANIVQPFAAAVDAPGEARREISVYLKALGRGPTTVAQIREDMGEPFTWLKLPEAKTESPSFAFAEL